MIPKDRLMIVGGVGDRLAPPQHASLLWEHWDRPAIHWFPGNHLIHFNQGEYLRHIAKFLARIGFLSAGSLPNRDRRARTSGRFSRPCFAEQRPPAELLAAEGSRSTLQQWNATCIFGPCS